MNIFSTSEEGQLRGQVAHSSTATTGRRRSAVVLVLETVLEAYFQAAAAALAGVPRVYF